MLLDKYIRGDSINVLPQIVDKQFDLILTDPPYNKNWTVDYGMNRRRKDTGIANDYRAEKVILDVFTHCVRVLRDDRPFFCFSSWDAVPFFVEILRDQLGLKYKNMIIWDKCLPNNISGDWKGSFGSVYEVILFFTKGRFILNPKIQGRKNDILKFKNPPVRQRLHPHQKPQELLKTIINYTTKEGDYVLDPFAGVGSTYYAAKELNRRCYAIELEEKWYKNHENNQRTS